MAHNQTPMPAHKKALICDLVSRAGGGLSYLHNIGSAFDDGARTQYEYTFLCHPAARPHTAALARYADVQFAPSGIPHGGARAYRWRKEHLRQLLSGYDTDIVLIMNECPVRLPVPTLLFLRNALYFARSQPAMRGKYPIKQWLRCTYLRRVSLRSMANADMLVTSSKSFAQLIAEDTRGPGVPTALAPFGTNAPTVAHTARDYERCSTLLCLQYNFYKGHETAIAAMAPLVAQHPRLQLLITDNLDRHPLPQARRAAAALRRMNLQRRVDCLGPVPHAEMSSVFARSDIFVFPSLIESFGQGLLEAMANGMPCVVADIPVFRELAGDCVLYHRPGDPDDLAARVSALLADKELRCSLGKRAQERAKAFTWPEHVAALERAFDSCLQRVSRSPGPAGGSVDLREERRASAQ